MPHGINKGAHSKWVTAGSELKLLSLSGAAAPTGCKLDGPLRQAAAVKDKAELPRQNRGATEHISKEKLWEMTL